MAFIKETKGFSFSSRPGAYRISSMAASGDKDDKLIGFEPTNPRVAGGEIMY
jgi:hypothetical protein